MEDTKELFRGLWVYKVVYRLNKCDVLCEFSAIYKDVYYKLVGDSCRESDNILGDRYLYKAVQVDRFKNSVVATYSSDIVLTESEVANIKIVLRDSVISCLDVERSTLDRCCAEISSLEF